MKFATLYIIFPDRSKYVETLSTRCFRWQTSPLVPDLTVYTVIVHQTRPDEFGGRSFEIPKWTSLVGGRVWWVDRVFKIKNGSHFLKGSVLEIHFKTAKKIRLRRANFRVDEFGGRTSLVGEMDLFKMVHRTSLVGGRVWWAMTVLISGKDSPADLVVIDV